jgi:hypothetical protein
MSFCTSCGRPVKASTRFCTGCGAALGKERNHADGGAPGIRADVSRQEADAPSADAPRISFARARGQRRIARTARDHQGKIVAAAVAIVVLAGGGTALALTLPEGRHPQADSALARSRAGGDSRLRPSSSQSASASPTPSSSQASPSTAPSAGGVTVTVADGVVPNPHITQVVDLLTSYFTAINNHDYRAYVSLFDQQFQQNYSPRQFSGDYSSTSDSAIRLTDLRYSDSDGLAAVVTFTSHQQPSQSPDNASCDNWTISLYLTQQAGGYVVGDPPQGYQPVHRPC